MSELTFEATHNGGSAEVRHGDVIVISLPESPSTGYEWTVDHLDEKLLKLQQTEFNPPREARIGGSGVRHFTFLATQSGSTALSLKLLRPWLGEASIIERYQIFLHIT
jgi:inhibitor of cysteine peptidase